MKRIFAAAIAAAALTATAVAQIYPKFVPPVPGTVHQNVTVFLSGQGMSSHWQATTSKTFAGRMNGKTPVYQWWLSVYSPPNGDTAKLALRSPGTAELLPKVEKAHGADAYYPTEDLTIIAGAQLERPQVDDLVTLSHVVGADCGMATVAIIGADAHLHTGIRARIDNYCDLSASIVNDGDTQAVKITGPYYTKNTPLCCPAKSKVTAILRYRGGKWIMTPAYFPLRVMHQP